MLEILPHRGTVWQGIYNFCYMNNAVAVVIHNEFQRISGGTPFFSLIAHCSVILIKFHYEI